MIKLNTRDFSHGVSKKVVEKMGGTQPTRENTILTITRERVSNPITGRIVPIYSLFQGGKYLFSIPLETERIMDKRLIEASILASHLGYSKEESDIFENHCMIKALLKQFASAYEGMVEKPERMQLRNLRQRLGFSMAELAKYSNTSITYISRIELDKYITYKTLFKFATILIKMKLEREAEQEEKVKSKVQAKTQTAQDKVQDQNQTTQPQDDQDDQDSQDSQDSQNSLDDILSDEAIDKLFGK